MAEHHLTVKQAKCQLRTSAQRLRSLSVERLRTASDFLADLQEREAHKATAELLAITGFWEDI
jgi:hypothetical protein